MAQSTRKKKSAKRSTKGSTPARSRAAAKASTRKPSPPLKKKIGRPRLTEAEKAKKRAAVNARKRELAKVAESARANVKKRAKAKKARQAAATKRSAVSKSPAIKSAGRKPFAPTDEQRVQVETMAGLGIRHAELCLLVINPKTERPIDEKTLRTHFRDELDQGPVKSSVNVAQSLYNKALGDGPGSVTAGIWWTKSRMGWHERSVVDVEVKSGVIVAPSGMTPEQWVARAAARAAEQEQPGVEREE